MSSSNIDALPYYDKQIDDPHFKAKAQALIEAEMRSTPKVEVDDPRLPPQTEIFSKSSGLRELLDNYNEHPIRGIDVSKYAPPQANPNESLDELKEIEKRGWIGEGHMALRNENVQILSTYGPNAWLVRNYQLSTQLTELQAAVTEMKERVTELNRARRVFQEDTGQHLSRLEGRWQDLVGATVQLEMACGAMEGEVEGLRIREERLQAEVKQLEG
ncbi:pre-mRNA-splicing factor SPF27 [Tremella mesenterica]|uniref:Pre-mRNA-splicing factor SPF27 n=1 Tax=Tremella mesenterica TaxID=5217 RepID=A0A4Q1BCX9_TREME|nr:pre-mRNA-splicing factor SPF27 [Tremella mesenterica]